MCFIYIIDSKPKETENGARKDMVRKLLVEFMVCSEPIVVIDDYNAPINSFDIIS